MPDRSFRSCPMLLRSKYDFRLFCLFISEHSRSGVAAMFVPAENRCMVQKIFIARRKSDFWSAWSECVDLY